MAKSSDYNELVAIINEHEDPSKHSGGLMSLDEVIRKHGQIVKLAIKNGRSWRNSSKIVREASTLKWLLELHKMLNEMTCRKKSIVSDCKLET